MKKFWIFLLIILLCPLLVFAEGDDDITDPLGDDTDEDEVDVITKEDVLNSLSELETFDFANNGAPSITSFELRSQRKFCVNVDWLKDYDRDIVYQWYTRNYPYFDVYNITSENIDSYFEEHVDEIARDYYMHFYDTTESTYCYQFEFEDNVFSYNVDGTIYSVGSNTNPDDRKVYFGEFTQPSKYFDRYIYAALASLDDVTFEEALDYRNRTELNDDKYSIIKTIENLDPTYVYNVAHDVYDTSVQPRITKFNDFSIKDRFASFTTDFVMDENGIDILMEPIDEFAFRTTVNYRIDLTKVNEAVNYVEPDPVVDEPEEPVVPEEPTPVVKPIEKLLDNPVTGMEIAPAIAIIYLSLTGAGIIYFLKRRKVRS